MPLDWPGYQASTTPATWFSHGMATGAPALITTTVCGLAAATAAISSSCADGRLRLSRSVASDSVSSETTTTAVLADLAAAAAAVMPGRQRRRRAPVSADDAPEMPERVGLARGQVHRHRVGVTGGVLGSSRICLPFRVR